MAVLLASYLRYDCANPKHPNNDRLIFCKGHACPLLYAMFKAAGAITDEELLTLRKLGSRLEGHPNAASCPRSTSRPARSGQGLPIGVGMALAGKYLDKLPYRVWVAARRQRDGRRLDLGGVRQGVVLQARQPDRHPRHEPARPARRDRPRLERRRLRRPRPRLRLARHRDRRPRPRRDRPRLRRGAAHNRRSRRCIVATTIKGKGVSVHGEQGRLARQGARRRAGRAAPSPSWAASATSSCSVQKPENRQPAPRPAPRAAAAADVRARRARRRRARPTATRSWRSARRARTSSRWTARCQQLDLRREFKKAYPDRFFEMFIAEQQMVAAAVGLAACAASVPFASTFAAFFTRAYDFSPHGRHLAAPTSACAARTPASDRRGRPVADGAGRPGDDARGLRQHGALPVRRRTRRRSSSRQMADLQGHLATCAPRARRRR